MKYFIYYLLGFYAVVCAFSIFYFDGTGDPGDSISHYLFARYAPDHPVLYFDHWAKPLFVLLASPFAQFGFTGMKVFNALVSLAVIFFTYRTAEQLRLPNAPLAVLMLVFSPLNYILTFSGLTEPLFALLTITGVYYCSRQNYFTASLLISFLPYVRSEGLIIIGVFCLYLLYKRVWTCFPVLLSGSVIYAIAGFFVHGDLLWVFTHIPYATLNSVYGRGGLLHFVQELINVTGVPVYFLFWCGFIALLVLLRKGFDAEQHILVLGGFLCFFVAHSLFWYLGIFNSMGLKRVLLGILPLTALIALQGFNALVMLLPASKIRLRTALQVCLIAYILVFPFTANPSAIHWKKDMMLSPEQKLAIEATDYLRAENKLIYPLTYNHRYLSVALNIDYFSPGFCRQISAQTILEMQRGDILIWDNLYARSESGILESVMDEFPGLTKLKSFASDEFGKHVRFSVYEKK